MSPTLIHAVEVSRLADARHCRNVLPSSRLNQPKFFGNLSRGMRKTLSCTGWKTKELSLGNRDADTRYLGPGSTEIPIGLVLS